MLVDPPGGSGPPAKMVPFPAGSILETLRLPVKYRLPAASRAMADAWPGPWVVPGTSVMVPPASTRRTCALKVFTMSTK
jgi:hypothetical protein